MEAFFLVGSIQALFFAILVFNKKREKQIADIILGIWLLSLSLTLLIPFFVYSEGTYKFFMLFSIDIGIFAAQPVWFYLYVISLTKKTNTFNPRLLLYFIPVIIVVILSVPLFQLSPDEISDIYDGTGTFPKITLYVGIPVFLLLNIYISILSLHRILVHRKNIKYTFSYEENIDLQWLLNLAVSYIIIFVLISITIVWYIFARRGNALFYDNLVGIFYFCFVFAIGYFGFKQGKIFSHATIYLKDGDTKNNRNSKNTSVESSGEENMRLATRLNNYASEHKPWLNPKLSLYDLANELNITSHQLSSLLNDYLKTNFYDYINHFRVEEVKKLLKSNSSQFTILALAFDCGFNSKASFNRIFKRKTGKTPSEFMKSNVNK